MEFGRFFHRTGSSAAKILKTSNLIGIQKFDWFNQSWQRCNKLRPGDHKEPLWASPNKISCFQLWKTQLVDFNGITLSISTPILRPYKSSSGGHGHDPLNGRDIFTFLKVLVINLKELGRNERKSCCLGSAHPLVSLPTTSLRKSILDPKLCHRKNKWNQI